MIVYYATGSLKALQAILRDRKILAGRNVFDGRYYVHLSRTPFRAGAWAVHVICGGAGRDSGARAWIFTLEIPDQTELHPDPSGEDVVYGGRWAVHCAPELCVAIQSITEIVDIIRWEEAGIDAGARVRYERPFDIVRGAVQDASTSLH